MAEILKSLNGFARSVYSVSMDAARAVCSRDVCNGYADRVAAKVAAIVGDGVGVQYQGFTALIQNNKWVQTRLAGFPASCNLWFEKYNTYITEKGYRNMPIDALGLRLFEVAVIDPALVGVMGLGLGVVALRIGYIFSSTLSRIGMSIGCGLILGYGCLKVIPSMSHNRPA